MNSALKRESYPAHGMDECIDFLKKRTRFPPLTPTVATGKLNVMELIASNLYLRPTHNCIDTRECHLVCTMHSIQSNVQWT